MFGTMLIGRRIATSDMTNINVNAPSQNPFGDILHNHLVFLHLYFDLPVEDEYMLSQTFVYMIQ
jgi:hypothetical protein